MWYNSVGDVPEDIYLATILNEVDPEDEEDDTCPNCGEDIDDCDCEDEDDFFDDIDIEE